MLILAGLGVVAGAVGVGVILMRADLVSCNFVIGFVVVNGGRKVFFLLVGERV
ncbi:hypothetical protein BKA61DRAFT_613454 [Leptodontidium sp. MPI-SDFR-AT-0119]|nr:hypothetical protein BKA61DRAFT_613454 [Leptodontidium sp. MPI-SDFR-AT-0119]